MATLLSIRVKRALAARLRTISVESGYLTNTGENIGLQRHVDPAEITDGYFPMAAVFTGSVEKQQEGGRSMRLARRFIVEHWINAYDEVERAGDAVDEQAADILKAALAGGGNLSDDDGPIGRLLFESSDPLPNTSSSAVEGQQQVFVIYLEEAHGDPTRRA